MIVPIDISERSLIVLESSLPRASEKFPPRSKNPVTARNFSNNLNLLKQKSRIKTIGWENIKAFSLVKASSGINAISNEKSEM
jgi:hypothetical protein